MISFFPYSTIYRFIVIEVNGAIKRVNTHIA